MTWGVYTPATASFDKHLEPEHYDPTRMPLIEIMSGHGNSEEFRNWREAGIDAVFNPTPDLRLRAGPRVFWGDNRYARTYFGVTAAESGASGLAAYTPSGGALSAGIELGAFYALNDEWGIDSALTWTRLTGDAGASPIVAQGDRDQFKLRVGLTKRFSFNF